RHPELRKPAPRIVAVDHHATEATPAGQSSSRGTLKVQARVAGEVPVETVHLYYASVRGGPFQAVEMKTDDASGDAAPRERRYSAEVPAAANVYYYVEARAAADIGTTVFSPARAEFATLHYSALPATVATGVAATATATKSTTTTVAGSPAPTTRTATIAINEVMAANNRTIKDPQGKFADWIELVNTGKEEVDLTGMYLSDDKSKPRKWKFPKGTTLAAGAYLIIWADEGGKSQSGLHANFKLAKEGEALLLIDRDDTLIDSLEFGEQKADVAYGRYPSGQGKWQLVPPTPGGPNQAGEQNGH
ncbi:MAG TPA: lamin tail domain-containing protein, partial [Pirellulales bacterium]|nr:lamin tail domain-containing protein [Pirellulales bacterium]